MGKKTRNTVFSPKGIGGNMLVYNNKTTYINLQRSRAYGKLRI